MNTRKQKILFLITKSNWGGAQKYVYDLATSLRNDFDVAVASGGDGRLVDMLRGQNIPIHPLPNLARDISFKKEFSAFFETVRMLRTIRPDILHLNSSKAGALGALAGRIARVPRIVFTAHAWAWNEERPFFARVAIALTHFATVILAHRTICVSNTVYDQMAKFPWTRSRMRIIHPGITPLPRVSREQARGHLIEQMPGLAEQKDGVWLGTIAELHPIKGLRYAIDAITTLRNSNPGLTYVIIGEGDERPVLTAQIHAKRLEKNVYLAGRINDAGSLLPAFDVFILPSLSEAFGYVLIEAGAAEVPVIATAVGGIPEVLTPSAGILVPPGRSDELAEEITLLLGSPETRRALTLTLKSRTEEYFTKDRMVEETMTLYKELAS